MGEKKRKLLLSKQEIKRLDNPLKEEELLEDYKALRKFALHSLKRLATVQQEMSKFLGSWSNELHEWRKRINAWNKTINGINKVLEEVGKKEGKRKAAKYIG